jgi:hypothetical protein
MQFLSYFIFWKKSNPVRFSFSFSFFSFFLFCLCPAMPGPAGLFFFVSPSESIGRLAAPSLPCRAGRTGQKNKENNSFFITL